MKKIEDIFLKKTNTSFLKGVQTANILENTQNFINNFFKNKKSAIALYVKNDILVIGCQSALLAEELRLYEKKLILYLQKNNIVIKNLRIKFVVNKNNTYE